MRLKISHEPLNFPKSKAGFKGYRATNSHFRYGQGEYRMRIILSEGKVKRHKKYQVRDSLLENRTGDALSTSPTTGHSGSSQGLRTGFQRAYRAAMFNLLNLTAHINYY